MKIWSCLFSGRHGIFRMVIFSYFEILSEILNMHFKDDPISDMQATNYLIIWYMKPLLRSSKFGPVFSR